ncbi:tellurium resistance protein TerD [Cyanobacterium sp. HL-69]|nr:tellurium resistance protein TerD [Cyanobacterium sp. HL-69]
MIDRVVEKNRTKKIMAISLQKGQRVSLDKVAPGLTAGFIGLGWDTNVTDTGKDFDLDASVFLLNDQEKLISDNHFIFYNNLTSPDPAKSVKHMGDNLTGEGEGDDEVIIVDLRKVPEDVQRIVVTVTIHEADKRGQNFGQVRNAFVRLVDVATKEEVLRYDLEEDFSVETALIMAELYRKDGEWRMNAVGAGYQGGLQALLNRYV